MTDGPDVTEWRLDGAALLVRLLPVLACLVVATWALIHCLRPGPVDSAYVLLVAEALLLAAALSAWVLRTRVRAVSAGVEVRELRTRTFAWEDIAWVEPTHGHRSVRLGFRDGSARTLPVPRRVGAAVADRRIDRLVTLLRRNAPHCRR